MGVEGIGNAVISGIISKRVDRSATGSVSVRKAAAKKKKRANYSYKRISAQILRAKTSGSAKQALGSARSQTALLRRKLATGDYDDTEIRTAIKHAEKMVKSAKKKMKHLQEEENAKKGGECQGDVDEKTESGWGDMDVSFDGMSAEEIEQLIQEMQQEIQQEAQDTFEEVSGLDLLSLETGRELDPADLEQLKKKHRSEEFREIMEADMKYLKAIFGQLQKEKQEMSSGVSLQLLGVEVPVAETPTAAAVVAEGGAVDTSV